MAEPAEMLTTPQLAEMLGVSPRRLHQLRNEPNPPPSVNGRFPCHTTGAWFRQRVVAELGVSKTGEIYDADAEKARLLFHQANIAELDEEVKRKSLIPADAVQTHWEQVAGNSRAKLLNLPGRLAVQVAGKTHTVQEVEQMARELVREALDELAGTNGVP